MDLVKYFCCNFGHILISFSPPWTRSNEEVLAKIKFFPNFVLVWCNGFNTAKKSE